MAWCYQQIKRMAEDLMHENNQKLYNALRNDTKADKQAFKDYLENN